MIRILQNNSYQCSVSKRTVVSGSKTALVGVHEIQFARKKKKKKKKKNWIVGKMFIGWQTFKNVGLRLRTLIKD